MSEECHTCLRCKLQITMVARYCHSKDVYYKSSPFTQKEVTVQKHLVSLGQAKRTKRDKR